MKKTNIDRNESKQTLLNNDLNTGKYDMITSLQECKELLKDTRRYLKNNYESLDFDREMLTFMPVILGSSLFSYYIACRDNPAALPFCHFYLGFGILSGVFYGLDSKKHYKYIKQQRAELKALIKKRDSLQVDEYRKSLRREMGLLNLNHSTVESSSDEQSLNNDNTLSYDFPNEQDNTLVKKCRR